MKRIYTLLILAFIGGLCLPAQTLSTAKTLYQKGEYEKAKPIFRKFLKSQPNNGNYNLWYGVCCLKTGEAEMAVTPLETAVKKRITGGQLYLAQTYDALYRYEEAVQVYEEYIMELEKRNRSTEQAEQLLEASKANLRMLKGVEQVCVIDSFVVDKDKFLSAYRISPESGKLSTYETYFNQTGQQEAIVYETEMGNNIYFSQMQADSTYSILTSSKLIDTWSEGTLLPESINEATNANYPYLLSDGITIYYAADGEGSIGGYDIFVTRYNPNTDTYLTPENIGMPFNSTANDYMYAIDEFNNLGWFASDRNQPEGKVCVYVFVPNTSKQVYNYEGMELKKLASLARLHSIQDTWTEEAVVTDARKRLESTLTGPAVQQKRKDFVFIVDDETNYYTLHDFRSSEARKLFQQYEKQEVNYRQQSEKLESLRGQYVQAEKEAQQQLSPAILDLEAHVLQLAKELEQTCIEIRRLEKQ